MLNKFRLRITLLYLTIRNRFSRATALGDVPVILTLTSYGMRVTRLWITLESIARGNARPQRFIVWLNESLKDCIL